MYPVGLATVTSLAVCFDLVCSYEVRQKKQLSPALQLENDINSILRLNELGYKRTSDHRLDDSPEVESSDSLDDLLTLQNIGKQPVINPANHLAEQLDVVQYLTNVGKKNSLSPATDFQQKLKFPLILMNEGR